MALNPRLFVPRPAPRTYVELTDGNRQELFDLISSQYANANDDGTRITWSHYNGGFSIVEGDWVGLDGPTQSVAGAVPAEWFAAGYQEVPEGDLEFNISAT